MTMYIQNIGIELCKSIKFVYFWLSVMNLDQIENWVRQKFQFFGWFSQKCVKHSSKKCFKVPLHPIYELYAICCCNFWKNSLNFILVWYFFLKLKNITKLCHKYIEISLKKRNFLFFCARSLKINRKQAIKIVEIEFKY